MALTKLKTKDEANISSKREIHNLFEAYAKTRDPEIKERIVLHYIKLARFLAGKFVYRGENLEDLVQIGCMGLIKAIERYDLSKGVEFTTYVTPTILGEIKRHFRDKGWAFKVPRRLQEMNTNVSKSTNKLATILNRPPTIAEIAGDLKLSKKDVLDAQKLNQTTIPLSFDAKSQDPEDKRTANLMDSVGNHDGRLEFLEEHLSLSKSFENLGPIEKIVLYLRFYQNFSQTEISKLVGLAAMDVSKLQTKAIEKLRKFLDVRKSP